MSNLNMVSFNFTLIYIDKLITIIICSTGVYLLNMNISQLRWYCDLTTQDLRPTLANLSGLLDTCSAACHVSSSTHSSPVRHQLPVAPPVLAGVARLTSSLVDMCGPSPIRRHNDKHEKVDMVSDAEVVDEETKVDECEVTVTGDSIESSKSENNCEEEENSFRDNYDIICDSTSDINIKDSNVSSKTFESSQSEECDLKQPVINGSCDETIEAVDQRSETNPDNTIEEAVEAADTLFWDTVADRTHALSVPNSFKRPLSRPY